MTIQKPAPSEVEAPTSGVNHHTGSDLHCNRRRFLAPSLASVMVLLAVISLSREVFLLESPGHPYILDRKAVAGQSVRALDIDSTSGQLDDTHLKMKSPPAHLDDVLVLQLLQ